MEHCKCYLDIQRKRYEDKFDVLWDIPEEILDYRIVKLVLQPLVENAIYHGMKPMSRKGCITVSGRLLEGFVELSVSDDGQGMTDSSLALIRESLNGESLPEDKHIGVCNVNQRLKLFFGDEYGLLVESSRDTGTTVLLRIPQKKMNIP